MYNVSGFYSKMYHLVIDFSKMAIMHVFLPSSNVLLTSTALFCPSPAEVRANTWNSYSVYFLRPVTFLDIIIALLIFLTVGGSVEPLIL